MNLEGLIYQDGWGQPWALAADANAPADDDKE
jgi:hypothetical protein